MGNYLPTDLRRFKIMDIFPRLNAFIRERTKKNRTVVCDGLILRMHYRWTLLAMLGSFIVVYYGWWAKEDEDGAKVDRIICVSHFSAAQIERTKEYISICLSYPFIRTPEGDRRYLLFYRWVHWLFLLLAAIFYIPRVIAKGSENEEVKTLLENIIKHKKYLTIRAMREKEPDKSLLNSESTYQGDLIQWMVSSMKNTDNEDEMLNRIRDDIDFERELTTLTRCDSSSDISDPCVNMPKNSSPHGSPRVSKPSPSKATPNRSYYNQNSYDRGGHGPSHTQSETLLNARKEDFKKMVLNATKRKDDVKEVVEHITRNRKFDVQKQLEEIYKEIEAKRFFVKTADYILFTKKRHIKLCWKYLGIHVICLAVDLLVVILLNFLLLQGRFFNYGFEFMRAYIKGRDPKGFTDYISQTFPPFASCELNAETQLTAKRTEVLGCHLTLMELYEKIFLFVWAWMFFLVVITFLYIVYIVVMFALYRKKIVKVNVTQLGYDNPQKTFEEVFKKFDYGNIFLLYLIKKQLNNTQYFELLRLLKEPEKLHESIEGSNNVPKDKLSPLDLSTKLTDRDVFTIPNRNEVNDDGDWRGVLNGPKQIGQLPPVGFMTEANGDVLFRIPSQGPH
ncbi:unnamed protein product [Meganyctiphanes norvegica]|uniref:Innexin n=1 Tax=Meganyctiphanes norvegica TaxID=48144 RepID=A0AAV2RXA9_MEGNR